MQTVSCKFSLYPLIGRLTLLYYIEIVIYTASQLCCGYRVICANRFDPSYLTENKLAFEGKTMKNKENREFASNIQRLFAFILDMIILALVGSAIGAILGEKAYMLGPYGKLIGFMITGIYFCLSEVFFGQSPGKKALRIKVVNADMERLNIKNTVIRYSIWAMCYFVNGLAFPPSKYEQFLSTLATFILFGIGSIILYLFLFNRHSRQSLHDVITKSYVVPVASAQAGIDKTINKRHFIFMSMAPALLLLGVFLFVNNVHKELNTDTGKLESIRASILQLDEVESAGVFEGRTTFKSLKGETSETTHLTVDAGLNQDSADDDNLAYEIANIVLSYDNDVSRKNKINIILKCGYDLGIWSWNSSHKYSYSPGEWVTRMESSE